MHNFRILVSDLWYNFTGSKYVNLHGINDKLTVDSMVSESGEYDSGIYKNSAFAVILNHISTSFSFNPSYENTSFDVVDTFISSSGERMTPYPGTFGGEFVKKSATKTTVIHEGGYSVGSIKVSPSPSSSFFITGSNNDSIEFQLNIEGTDSTITPARSTAATTTSVTMDGVSDGILHTSTGLVHQHSLRR